MRHQHFVKKSEIAASPEEVFAFHEQPGAVAELTPPWEEMQVLSPSDGLTVGSRAVFKVGKGLLTRTWIAEHVEYERNRLFADVQIDGPFAYWYHRHRFEATGRATTLMIDEVEYSLPLGWLGEWVAGDFTRRRLQRMFDYRHRRLAEILKRG